MPPQRVKVHDSLSFPHELDMSTYIKDAEADQCIYELMSVFMHTGSAHAGHYFAYIRYVNHNACGGFE